jgi:hypothetical protein
MSCGDRPAVELADSVEVFTSLEEALVMVEVEDGGSASLTLSVVVELRLRVLLDEKVSS